MRTANSPYSLSIKIDAFSDCGLSNNSSPTIERLHSRADSVVVNIPKKLLKALKAREGSEVFIKQMGDKLIISSKNNYLSDDVDLKFIKMIEEFADEHDDVLRELAKR